MEIKQHSQATTIENLRLETGWKFNALLIKDNECTKNLVYVCTQIFVFQKKKNYKTKFESFCYVAFDQAETSLFLKNDIPNEEALLIYV